jgi:competence CoiA-like predicted nuclease
MLIGLNYQDQRIVAEKADKSEKYCCPLCKKPVLLKQGLIRTHHFAHETILDCENVDGEMTEWHIGWQKSLGVDNAEKIIKIGKHTKIADISINNVVVEFQHSSITYQETKERSIFYTQDKRKCVWIFDFMDKYKDWKIKIHKSNGANNLVFKWNNANKAVLAAYDNHKRGNLFLFLQIAEDKIVQVSWVPFDDKKEQFTFKAFAGYIRTKAEVIGIIKSKVDLDWKETPNYEKTNEYFKFLQLLEMIEFRVI